METVNNSEKNGEQAIEKMAAAARALGWPEQIVDATRAQMQNITKMQIQMMDHMMDAWEEQIKSPNPMAASPSAMLSKLKSLSSFGPAGSWPNVGAVQMTAMNPWQFYVPATPYPRYRGSAFKHGLGQSEASGASELIDDAPPADNEVGGGFFPKQRIRLGAKANGDNHTGTAADRNNSRAARWRI